MLGKKSDPKDLKKALFLERENAWDHIPETQMRPLESYMNEYRSFLDFGKTERESVDTAIEILEKAGYVDIRKTNDTKNIYYNHYGRAVAIFRQGKAPIEKNLRILVAHIDSPRLDLKQYPLYEDEEIAMFKTHYYGGIKKYQWVSRPLALHGVVAFPDGTVNPIVIGEDEDDPVFTIADLLPHLAGKAQMGKNAKEFIPGEKLNILIGGKPFNDDKELKDRVKLHVLSLLNDTYGITEKDFVSADLEIVPAGKSRDVGLDRAFIGGYGQDDRVCSFASLKAVIDAEDPEVSSLVLLLDKEEIGSEGAAGANTVIAELVLGYVLARHGLDKSGVVRRMLANAQCLSADVNAAVHPDWKEVHELRNAGYINGGLTLSKFTGVRGKGGSNEASAEFVARLRRLFDDSGIIWRIAELGKVDEGGGGTIAKFMSYYCMNVIDAGVSVLDMHSPFEITSKADIWMMYNAFKAFLED
ncbi:MAG: aminopeptidase [Candidatus Marinimicrobia bacterium]|nr:aminopeptidase [Candidatus Neomarinimicrobiota bacterium]